MNAPHAAHDIRLLRSGVALFPALIEAFDQAQHEVLLETYIFDFAGAGGEVAQALVRAAQRGVRVCLVVDGVGTGALPPEWGQCFQQAGVQCRVYSPLAGVGFWLPSRWRRLHRKLCVVDRAVAFCGGINLVDDFIDPNVPEGLEQPRLDYGVSLRGPLVAHVHNAMSQLWSRIEAVRELRSQDIAGALEALRSADQGLALPTHGTVQLVLRDNVRHRTQIERAYRKAIGAARPIPRRGGGCVCVCCCKASTNTSCLTARHASSTASSWQQGWKFTNTTPVCCTPKWPWWMAIGPR